MESDWKAMTTCFRLHEAGENRVVWTREEEVGRVSEEDVLVDHEGVEIR